MPRKDYILIAKALREARDAPTKSQLDSACLKIAAAMGWDNPRFDSGRFFKACGYTLSKGNHS